VLNSAILAAAVGSRTLVNKDFRNLRSQDQQLGVGVFSHKFNILDNCTAPPATVPPYKYASNHTNASSRYDHYQQLIYDGNVYHHATSLSFFCTINCQIEFALCKFTKESDSSMKSCQSYQKQTLSTIDQKTRVDPNQQVLRTTSDQAFLASCPSSL
jgi:hypothetical protein